MTARTPSWYDLVGVAPSATPEEIRDAWRSGIADLDPTDRRFVVLNEAAGVLLDPDRRAAYDATLEPEPVSLTKPLSPAAPASPAAGDEGPSPSASRVRFTVPGWLLIGLALLTVAMIGLGGWLATKPSDDSVADSTSAAQSAAERAIVTVLAYDYRHLEEDQQAAGALMTSSYRKDYDALFAQIKANAPQTKTIVTAQVIASGVVRSGQDRVQVLLFVNRPTSNAVRNEISKDQVTVTMAKVGGQWLVDDLKTSPTAA